MKGVCAACEGQPHRESENNTSKPNSLSKIFVLSSKYQQEIFLPKLNFHIRILESNHIIFHELQCKGSLIVRKIKTNTLSQTWIDE